MTLSMEALRWITVRALRDMTLAGAAVFDSPSEPADVRIEAERLPYIGVFTDDADMTLSMGENPENSWWLGELSVKLVIEIAVPEKVTLVPEPNESPDENPGPATAVILTNTDEALELAIGLACRQVFDALAADTVWATLWRKLAYRRRSVSVRRGGTGFEDGRPTARIASRIIVIDVDVLREPVRGEGLERFPFWRDFLSVLDVDTEFGKLDELLIAHFESDEADRPAWKSLQKMLMINRDTLHAIGDGPVEQLADDPEQDATPLPTEITLIREGDEANPMPIVPEEEEEP